MRTARDAGEPISKGRVDRRATEARALRDALLGVALFAGIVLVNAILAILFIALMQALGLWMPEAAETKFIPPDRADELPTTLHPLAVRRASSTS